MSKPWISLIALDKIFSSEIYLSFTGAWLEIQMLDERLGPTPIICVNPEVLVSVTKNIMAYKD